MAPKPKSNSLKRVIANKKNQISTFEGIFLSNDQLITLGTELNKMKAAKNSPDGVCFMIGVDTLLNKRTVEIVPYNYVGNPSIKFHKQDNVEGKLDPIDLGSPFPVGGIPMTLDGDGLHPTPIPPPVDSAAQEPVMVAFGLTTPSQRTPPPFPE